MYLVLQRHLDIMKLACTKTLHGKEFTAASAAIVTMWTALYDRVQDLNSKSDIFTLTHKYLMSHRTLQDSQHRDSFFDPRWRFGKPLVSRKIPSLSNPKL